MAKIHKGWKKLEYWQKFGFIISISYLVIAIFSLIEFIINMNKSDMGTIGYWVIMTLGFFISMLYEGIFFLTNNYTPIQNEIPSLVIFILITAILYFFIGALIGIVVKGRKKSQK